MTMFVYTYQIIKSIIWMQENIFVQKSKCALLTLFLKYFSRNNTFMMMLNLSTNPQIYCGASTANILCGRVFSFPKLYVYLEHHNTHVIIEAIDIVVTVAMAKTLPELLC